MKKIISDNIIRFYSDDGSEIMYIGFRADECIWFFHSSDVIKITEDMELYGMLDNLMRENYTFSNGVLRNHKDNSRLTWYSDCYYDPDDEFSIASVSCLNIERKKNSFDIWCSKELDKKWSRADKSHCICFSPCGNGTYSRNTSTGSTLQNDFVTLVYQPSLLKNAEKVLKK